MDKLKDKIEPNRPTCEQCRKEIPPETSRSMEAADYIHHFCGSACYAEWQNKQAEGSKSGKQ